MVPREDSLRWAGVLRGAYGAMLDGFYIFTRGGLVLWSQVFFPLEGNPVNSLIESAIVQERTGVKEQVVGKYTLKYATDNDTGVFFVVRFKLLVLGFAVILTCLSFSVHLSAYFETTLHRCIAGVC